MAGRLSRPPPSPTQTRPPQSMDVMDIGRMAFFVDPTGAVLGVWQPKTFAGADLVNEPNSLCWNEVLTRDAETDKVFYPAVFGWVAGRPLFEGAPESYTVWELGGKPVGGMMQMADEYFPPEAPPHWGVRFAVADCDATVVKARTLGATITMEPMDMPIGRSPADRSTASVVLGDAAGAGRLIPAHTAHQGSRDSTCQMRRT
jgi:predicted enzyme related to lactoylglutathione lyase